MYFILLFVLSETTATAKSTTRQDTSPITTTLVSTIDLSTTTDITTSNSSTLSLTSDILFTDFSPRDGSATLEYDKAKPISTIGDIIIIVACLACLLLLVTVIIAVFFVRKRNQAQIPATTPDVTYENVGAPRQNLQSTIGVVGASGQNLQSETGVVGASGQNQQRSNFFSYIPYCKV